MSPSGKRCHYVFLAKDKEGREKEKRSDGLSKQLAVTTIRVVNYIVYSGLDTFSSVGTGTVLKTSPTLRSRCVLSDWES